MQRSKRKRFDQLDENEDQATQNDKQEDWRGRKDVTEQTCDSTLPSSTSACPCRDDDQTEPECDADVIQHAGPMSWRRMLRRWQKQTLKSLKPQIPTCLALRKKSSKP